MNGRTVALYPQPSGNAAGFMPVPALERPGAYTLEFLASGGAVLHSAPVTVRDAHFRTQNVAMGKAIAGLKPAPGETEDATRFRNTVSGERYWEEPLALPVAGCMTSPFGVMRLRNGKPTGDYHAGIDQRAPAGAPVRAIASGVVRLVRPWVVHGNTVGIDHGQGVASMYLHLSRFAVAEGARVKRSDVVGYAGSTGRSTAPHLHWSLYVNTVPVNPAQWVRLRPCDAGASPRRESRGAR
jgi:murein DD-endopeptidase MepM/ murein hydrolase activator NlpD